MSRKFLQLVLISVLTAFTVSAKMKYYAKISQPVQGIVDSIRKYNRLESASIGITGAPSQQFNRYMQLRDKATAEELVTIIKNDKNGVVRVYAYYALKTVAAMQAEKLAPTFAKDRTIIEIMNGCVVDKKKVKDVLSDNIVE